MILRRLARPMLAAVFISGGINALRAPEAHAEAAKPLLAKAGDKLPDNADPVTLVRVDGAVKVAAGLALAFGKVPRLAALLLSASVVPTTVAAHPFWEEKDPAERKQQLTHFLKNVGLLGGLLLAAVDTHGKPSVAWRAKRATHDLGDWISDTSDSVGSAVASAPRKAKKAVSGVLPG
ncbi:DoxX family protein [Actinokineospora diospyrosa]|uniref:Membrane protein YphA, DoxX/SURF4 family n=1 Tax=Actinokineospora diospyrosa TaxID=103728 RepID=A0ABT1I798_9PSEU|nr:DoxX family protein [Actinokineospora diospyrosa]MCP2268496.1 putative membrane protein YphA, DoxX/SURF4 family [Actinokineospora diospyrosa]